MKDAAWNENRVDRAVDAVYVAWTRSFSTRQRAPPASISVAGGSPGSSRSSVKAQVAFPFLWGNPLASAFPLGVGAAAEGFLGALPIIPFRLQKSQFSREQAPFFSH